MNLQQVSVIKELLEADAVIYDVERSGSDYILSCMDGRNSFKIVLDKSGGVFYASSEEI